MNSRAGMLIPARTRRHPGRTIPSMDGFFRLIRRTVDILKWIGSGCLEGMMLLTCLDTAVLIMVPKLVLWLPEMVY